jgi:DNA-binding response OmpR family regulator
MKILVVAGEPLTAFELTSIFEEAGHQVIGPAHSSPTALSMAQDEQLDLAVLTNDLGMHAELADALREQQGTVSLLVSEAPDQVDSVENLACEAMGQPTRVHDASAAVEVVRTVLAAETPIRTLERVLR